MCGELVGVAAGSLLAGRLAAGMRWQRLLAPALLMMAAALGLAGAIPLLPGPWRLPVTFGLLLVAGVGGGLIIVGCEAFIQNRPPASQRGRMIAAANFAAFVGICLSGPVSWALIPLLPPASAMAAAGGICLAGCLIIRHFQGQRSRLGDWVWLALVRGLLMLRYRVQVYGRKAIAQRGRRGILFLANHPALIDPVILYSRLFGAFHIRSLADRTQIDRPLIRQLARRVGVIVIPDPAVEGAAAAQEVRQALRQCAEGLRHGENLLLYPAGGILRTRYEDLGGSAAADLLLQEVPEARVVLIRTRGLWGSGFGRAAGRAPSVAAVLWRGGLGLLASGLFFAPRRRVRIELAEPSDVPPGGDRGALNRYLEAYFNVGAERRTYVPYWLFGGPTRLLSEPAPPRPAALPTAAMEVPPAVRTAVTEYLCQVLKLVHLSDSDELGRDLGMDSLGRADLAVWLTQRFGVGPLDGDGLKTVVDVLLAAWGQAAGAREPAVVPPTPRWFARTHIPACPPGMADMNICQAFLHQARRGPGRPSMADALAQGRSTVGRTRTYRDVVAAVAALRGPLAAIAQDRLGILLPASVAANITYLSALFAGKTPVMINWTLGSRALAAGLVAAQVQTVLTSRRLLGRLEAQGVSLEALRGRLLFLEDLAAGLSLRARLAAGARARFSWKALERAAAGAPEMAAILFTSGSEGQPKAVPLTHRNLLTNLAGAFTRYIPREDDVVLGMLPPFHTFGLTATMLLATCLGARVVYSPSPTDGATLAKTIEAYRATMLITTPTFLRGILRAGGEMPAPAGAAGPLASLRLIISGAEACPPALATALASACPEATLLEGYGVTECSPIITFNDQRFPRPGTIGRPLESYEILLRDEQTGEPAAPGGRGELLVRGPCVFGGYLGEDVLPPWVDLAGKRWYPTGDIVSPDTDGALRFIARRRRFIKRGGELISLPAIEAALAERYGDAQSDIPTLAVVADPTTEGHPQIVLVTTKEIPLDQANAALRQAGLSPLYSLQQVIRVEALPLLGTGKTHYRALEQRVWPSTCPDEEH
jgi:long-chain-fatty-acid--[acyl-carrier-protein] ligase